MNHTLFKRIPTLLDKVADDSKTGEGRPAFENKESYLNSFGIKFILPAEYILDAKIALAQDHDGHSDCEIKMYQLVKYTFPTEEANVCVHLLDDPKPIKTTYREMFEKYEGNLVLRELQYKNKQVSKAGEVILYGATSGSMVFSPDGNFLAVLTRAQGQAKSNNLYICHGQEIIANFNSYNLREQGQISESCNIQLKEAQPYIAKIKFDKSGTKLVGYGTD
jgi:hypothetical protein